MERKPINLANCEHPHVVYAILFKISMHFKKSQSLQTQWQMGELICTDEDG
jgi:hypothetical protein